VTTDIMKSCYFTIPMSNIGLSYSANLFTNYLHFFPLQVIHILMQYILVPSIIKPIFLEDIMQILSFNPFISRMSG